MELYVCKICGTLHEDMDEECCGETVVGIEEAFDYQMKLFDLANDDRAKKLLDVFKANYDMSVADVRKCEQKLSRAMQAREAAAGNLVDFYQLSVEAER